jgi:hypothetical protein
VSALVQFSMSADKAHMPPGRGVASFGGQAHQQGPIADVVAQGAGDAALQEGLRAIAAAAGGGAHQLQAGLLAQVLQFHQVSVAAAEAPGDAIRQGEVLLYQGVAVVGWGAATATASTTRPN